MRRSCRKDAVRPTGIGRRLRDEIEPVDAIELPEHVQMREPVDVREALLELRQHLQPAFRVVPCPKPFGDLLRLRVRRSSEPDGARREHAFNCIEV